MAARRLTGRGRGAGRARRGRFRGGIRSTLGRDSTLAPSSSSGEEEEAIHREEDEASDVGSIIDHGSAAALEGELDPAFAMGFDPQRRSSLTSLDLATGQPQRLRPLSGLSFTNNSISELSQPAPSAVETSETSCQTDPMQPELEIREVVKEIPIEKVVEKIVQKEVPVDRIVEVVKEVPVEVERVVEKEVPVEKIVEVERIVEREVPVEKIVEVERIVEKEVPVEKIVEVVKEVPVEVEKIIEVPVDREVVREVPIEVFKEVPPEVKEVIREVPVEKIVEKEVVKEVPVEVIKEVPVDRIVEKEVVKEVPVEVEKVVYVDRPVEIQVSAPSPEIGHASSQTDPVQPEIRYEVREVVKEVFVPQQQTSLSRKSSAESVATTVAGASSAAHRQDGFASSTEDGGDTDFEDARETIGAATPSMDRQSGFFSFKGSASRTGSDKDFYSIRESGSQFSLAGMATPDTPTRRPVQHIDAPAVPKPVETTSTAVQTDPLPVPQTPAVLASLPTSRSKKDSDESAEATQVLSKPVPKSRASATPTYLQMVGPDRMATPSPTATVAKEPWIFTTAESNDTYHTVYSPLNSPHPSADRPPPSPTVSLDRSKPPQLTMPPPPSMPPPKTSSPRKPMNRPPRPNSPPPPDLLQRAQTPISELMQHYPGYAGRPSNAPSGRTPFSSMPPNAMMSGGGARTLPRASTGNLRNSSDVALYPHIRSDSPHTLPAKMRRRGTTKSSRADMSLGGAGESLSIRSGHSKSLSVASSVTSDGGGAYVREDGTLSRATGRRSTTMIEGPVGSTDPATIHAM